MRTDARLSMALARMTEKKFLAALAVATVGLVLTLASGVAAKPSHCRKDCKQDIKNCLGLVPPNKDCTGTKAEKKACRKMYATQRKTCRSLTKLCKQQNPGTGGVCLLSSTTTTSTTTPTTSPFPTNTTTSITTHAPTTTTTTAPRTTTTTSTTTTGSTTTSTTGAATCANGGIACGAPCGPTGGNGVCYGTQAGCNAAAAQLCTSADAPKCLGTYLGCGYGGEGCSCSTDADCPAALPICADSATNGCTIKAHNLCHQVIGE